MFFIMGNAGFLSSTVVSKEGSKGPFLESIGVLLIWGSGL